MIRSLAVVTVAGVVYVAAVVWSKLNDTRNTPAGVRWE